MTQRALMTVKTTASLFLYALLRSSQHATQYVDLIFIRTGTVIQTSQPPHQLPGIWLGVRFSVRVQEEFLRNLLAVLLMLIGLRFLL